MLKSWSIQNFKAIVDSGELKLAPVTVLAGLNSSGKSSLLQSILMIAQTLSNKVIDRPLITNGTIVQLGTFTDVLSEFSGSHHMVFKFELNYDDMVDGLSLPTGAIPLSHKVAVSLSSASNNNTNTSAIEAAKVVVDSVSMETDSKHASSLSKNELMKRSGDTYGNIHYSFIVRRDPNDKPKGAATFSHLTRRDTSQIGYVGESILEVEGSKLGVPKQFVVTLIHFLPASFVGTFDEVGEGIGNDTHTRYLAEVLGQITQFFTSKIRYLGPLRADPGTTQQTFSPTGELDDVGSKGEYAAMVYNANQLASIEYYNPFTNQVMHATLQESLDVWTKYLEVADQVRTEVAGMSGITWKVTLKQGQKPRTLPQVGVGVSQVLPILVMGLLSPKNSFLIIEQPELHLHARVQARLGDFFVGLSKCNKQCLIETHSENLVSQLRLHIVQSGGLANSDCMIYFVDQDEQGAAKFEEVKISERGNILNWPSGFFDESMHQEDKITAASIRRRAKLAKKND